MNAKAQENLKIYFWGKVHFVLGLLTRDIANYSFAQITSFSQAFNPLSVEEVDDHDEREVDEGDEALPICPSDEDFVLGEIGESSNQLSESESDSFKCCHLKQHLYKEHIRNIF